MQTAVYDDLIINKKSSDVCACLLIRHANRRASKTEQCERSKDKASEVKTTQIRQKMRPAWVQMSVYSYDEKTRLKALLKTRAAPRNSPDSLRVRRPNQPTALLSLLMSFPWLQVSPASGKLDYCRGLGTKQSITALKWPAIV